MATTKTANAKVLMPADFSFIYCTCPDFTTAEKIAAALLDEKLIACANILPGMTSLYRWQGKVERSEEVVLILKSKPEIFPEIEKRIVDLHPYQIPCLVELPISQGNEKFLDWIAQETKNRMII